MLINAVVDRDSLSPIDHEELAQLTPPQCPSYVRAVA